MGRKFGLMSFVVGDGGEGGKAGEVVSWELPLVDIVGSTLEIGEGWRKTRLKLLLGSVAK